MRLGEAIQLGAMIKPQVFGTFLVDEGACAVGAALLAIGGQPEELAWSSLIERWPWAATVSWNCPSCGGSAPALAVIIHLNDQHRWNREELSRWVATMEPESGHEAPEPGQLGEPLYDFPEMSDEGQLPRRTPWALPSLDLPTER